MASPVQIGDIIVILTKIYNVYEAYRSTPGKLRQALKKFEDAESECKALNAVLASSRRRENQLYPGTWKLEADLEKAKNFFERYEPLTSADGKVKTVAKARRITSAKWNWSDVEQHVATIDMHRDNMKDFKQTVLIQAAQDNVELHIHSIRLQLEERERSFQAAQPPLRDDASAASSDQISILSKASKSLKATSQWQRASSRPHRLRLSPVVEASSASPRSSDVEMSDDLKDRMATFIERRELHRANSLQFATMQDFEYLAKLPQKWLQSQKQQPSQLDLPSPQLSIPPTPQITLRAESISDTFSTREMTESVETILRCPPLRGESASISPSWRSVLGKVQYGHGSTASSSISERILGQPALDLDTVTVSGVASVYSTESEEDAYMVINGVELVLPWQRTPPMPCRLRVIPTDASLNVEATTVETFHPTALPPLGGNGPLTPSDLMRSGHKVGDTDKTTIRVPIVFTQAIQLNGGMRSFPKVLHPRAETVASATNTYPYMIDFYEHQFVKVEAYSKLPMAVRGLGYRFQRKEDRDTIREQIFGKQLLASIGVAKIQFDQRSPTPCGTQAATLWGTRTKEDPRTTFGDLTITIQCSTRRDSTKPDCAIEFTVLKLISRNLDKLRKSEGKELELEILQLQSEDPEDMASERSGSVVSGNSTGSNISVFSESAQSTMSVSPEVNAPAHSSFFSNRRSSSVVQTPTRKPPSPLRCYLTFSEGPSLTKAKGQFLDALQAYFRS